MTAILSPAANRATRMVFAGKQQVLLESFEVCDPADDEVLVETRFSLMSTGTENIVVNCQFDAGTHWHRWVQYPFSQGMLALGRWLKPERP
ncbi:MAG: hypothetical protein ACREH8_06645 [Opitutaceae bacterium]